MYLLIGRRQQETWDCSWRWHFFWLRLQNGIRSFKVDDLGRKQYHVPPTSLHGLKKMNHQGCLWCILFEARCCQPGQWCLGAAVNQQISGALQKDLDLKMSFHAVRAFSIQRCSSFQSMDLKTHVLKLIMLECPTMQGKLCWTKSLAAPTVSKVFRKSRPWPGRFAPSSC